MENLKKSVAEAREMRDFANSPLGGKFIKLLEEQYCDLVKTACRESKYAPAIKTLENLASRVGSTIDIGKAAASNIEQLRSGKPIEEW